MTKKKKIISIICVCVISALIIVACMYFSDKMQAEQQEVEPLLINIDATEVLVYDDQGNNYYHFAVSEGTDDYKPKHAYVHLEDHKLTVVLPTIECKCLEQSIKGVPNENSENAAESN